MVLEKALRTTKRLAPLLGVTAGVALIFVMARTRGFEMESPLLGKPAPSFAATTTEGSIDSSKVLGKGQWVLINFWTTSCSVCREEAPELKHFVEEIAPAHPLRPAFISVNLQDPKANVMAFARAFSFFYPVVLDVDAKMGRSFMVTATPETYFVDPMGIVRHRLAGGATAEDLARTLETLDNERSNAQTQKGM